MLQCGAKNAKLDPKLGCPAGLRIVIFRRIEIAKAVLQGIDRPAKHRRRNAGDRDHGEKRQLKAGLKQSAGIHQQDAERSDAEGVQSSAVAKEQPREQINVERDGGPHDGRAKIRDKRVTPRENQREDRRPRLAEGQTAQQPENREGQDADVDPGDDQDVIGAGALEIGLDVAAEECAPADERCLHQRAALSRP